MAIPRKPISCSHSQELQKALKLSNYHDAYLKKVMDENPGDPDWAILYNLWKNAGNRKFVLFVDTLLRRELT